MWFLELNNDPAVAETIAGKKKVGQPETIQVSALIEKLGEILRGAKTARGWTAQGAALTHAGFDLSRAAAHFERFASDMLHQITKQERLAVGVIASLLVFGVLGIWILG